MPGPVFREGETVALRTIEEEDVAFLGETINDPRVRRNIAVVDPQNRADEREWVESIGGEGGYHFLVCAADEPVGVVGLDDPDDVWGLAEAGFVIRPEHRDNGYATDALGTVCGYAFEERRYNKVSARAYATNPASRRVLEKVGFAEEGVLREEAFVDGEFVDVHRYGLLADEWRS